MKLLQMRRDEDQLILYTDEGTAYLMPVQENIIRNVDTKRDELSNRSLMVMRKSRTGYESFLEKCEFRIVLGEESRTVEYHGDELKIRLS